MKSSLVLDRHHDFRANRRITCEHLKLNRCVGVPTPRLLFPKVQDGDGAWDAGDVWKARGEEPPSLLQSSTASHFLCCVEFKSQCPVFRAFRIWFNHIYSFILMISCQRRHYFQDVSYLCWLTISTKNWRKVTQLIMDIKEQGGGWGVRVCYVAVRRLLVAENPVLRSRCALDVFVLVW